MMILVCFLSFSRGFLRGFVYGLRGWMLDCPCPSLKLYCQLVDQLTTALPSKFGPGSWQPAWDLFAPTLQQYRAAVGEFSRETIVCVAPLHFTRLFCCSTASLSCWHTAAHRGLSPEPPQLLCFSPQRPLADLEVQFFSTWLHMFMWALIKHWAIQSKLILDVMSNEGM